jgi:pimeloyl-ACP methyl ester carboxylesterase
LPTASVNGARLNFVQLHEGKGEAEHLVMLHGLAANIAFWYFKYACELAKDFRVTVFDLRGHGRSEMTQTGYSPQALASDLEALLDQLAIDKTHLLAHSFGGVVAMRFALKNPHRVRSLVLADTHIATVRQRADVRLWSRAQAIQSALDAHGFDLSVRDPHFGLRLLTRVAQMQQHSIPVPAEIMELVSPLLGKSGARTAAQWLKLVESTDAGRELMSDDGLSLESLRNLRFEIMAMYGDRSPAKLTGTELLEIWPHAVFRNVRHAGHFFPSTRSADVITACRRFWGIDARRLQPRARAGEVQRSYFRSDRIFQETAGWYFRTRELPRIGPFPGYEEAESVLRHAVLNNLGASL